MSDIGLFPLQLVLLPSEVLPLHIFEDRYKELIGECISADEEFGLVFADDDGLHEVGTLARVAEVLTEFPDGRLNILVLGGDRFRLAELTSGRTFQTGLVSELDDEDDPAEPEAVERALGLFEQLRQLTRSEVELPDESRVPLSYLLASRVELPVHEKLELLDERSERRRMELVGNLFEAAVARAEQVRLASERATTNGRVELG
jgi:Lon protease-like protein